MSSLPDFVQHYAVINPETCSPDMIAANKDKVYEVLGFSSFMNQPCFIVADENGKYNTLPITKLLRKREEKVNVKSRNNKGRTNTGAAESITSNQDNTEDSDNE